MRPKLRPVVWAGALGLAVGCSTCSDAESLNSDTGSGRRLAILGVDRLYEVGLADVPLHRVFSGFVDRDGRAFLAHASENEVLVIAPTGQVIDRFGTRGFGPGEFGRLTWIQPFGADSLVAYDGQTMNATVFHRSGAAGRIIPVPTDREGQDLRFFSASHSGELLLGFSSGLDPRRLSSPAQDTLVLLILDTKTGSATRIARVPDRWWIGGRRGNAATMSALEDSGFAVIAHDRQDRIAIGFSTRPVLEEIAVAAGADARRREVRPVRDSSAFEGLEQILYDSEQRLWVRPSSRGEPNGDMWRVWDSDRGEELGTLELPRQARILDISYGYLLTRHVNDDDVESVVLWRIREGG